MTVYTFTSVGRKRIEKMVEFTSLGIKIDGVYAEVKYDPQVNAGYEAFLVKKIN
jgi:hypothetical protein